MGAATVTNITYGGTGNFKSRANSVHFNRRIVRALITPSASYNNTGTPATSGDSVSVASLGLKTVDYATVLVSEFGTRSGMQIPSAATYHAGRFITINLTDPAAPLVRVFTALDTEAANGTNQSGIGSFLVEFYGN